MRPALSYYTLITCFKIQTITIRRLNKQPVARDAQLDRMTYKASKLGQIDLVS